jgi:hypothetical protein
MSTRMTFNISHPQRYFQITHLNLDMNFQRLARRRSRQGAARKKLALWN